MANIKGSTINHYSPVMCKQQPYNGSIKYKFGPSITTHWGCIARATTKGCIKHKGLKNQNPQWHGMYSSWISSKQLRA